MAEYRVPTTEKVGELITTHAAVLETHGVSAGLAASRPASSAAGKYYFSTDTLLWSRDNGATWDDIQGGLSEAEVLALIEVDANLSAAAQAAILASHAAPTYDGVNKEVVFVI